jgi:hypothetical protein
MQVRGGSKMAKDWCAFSPADMFLAYSRLSGAGFVHLGYLIVTEGGQLNLKNRPSIIFYPSFCARSTLGSGVVLDLIAGWDMPQF